MSRGFFRDEGFFLGDDMVSFESVSLGGLSSKVPELQASELQMERSINLEELESTVGKCHRRRLEYIIFVNRVEVDKSNLLWMTSSRRVDGSNR